MWQYVKVNDLIEYDEELGDQAKQLEVALASWRIDEGVGSVIGNSDGGDGG